MRLPPATLLVILCCGTADQALAVMRDLMRRITLEVNEEKTRIVNARHASFDFLGYRAPRTLKEVLKYRTS